MVIRIVCQRPIPPIMSVMESSFFWGASRLSWTFFESSTILLLANLPFETRTKLSQRPGVGLIWGCFHGIEQVLFFSLYLQPCLHQQREMFLSADFKMVAFRGIDWTLHRARLSAPGGAGAGRLFASSVHTIENFLHLPILIFGVLDRLIIWKTKYLPNNFLSSR